MPKTRPQGVQIKDIRRMEAPRGYKPNVIKNSGTKYRSIRKGYKTPSNKNINTLSNPDYSNTGNIMYRNGVKHIIGTGHKSSEESDQVMIHVCSMPDGMGVHYGGCPDGYLQVLSAGAPPGSGWFTPGDGAPAYCSCIPMQSDDGRIRS